MDHLESAPVESNRAELDSCLIDVKGVAAMLACSARHVYRLADAGRMPPPIKLGALVRWSRRTVNRWLADGCPSSRKGGRDE